MQVQSIKGLNDLLEEADESLSSGYFYKSEETI
jgi:hypothetical protein